jgi:hypothetical protein
VTAEQIGIRLINLYLPLKEIEELLIMHDSSVNSSVIGLPVMFIVHFNP